MGKAPSMWRIPFATRPASSRPPAHSAGSLPPGVTDRSAAEDFLYAKDPGGGIVDRCRRRRDYVVKIIAPNNLTTDKATRLAEHVRTLGLRRTKQRTGVSCSRHEPAPC